MVSFHRFILVFTGAGTFCLVFSLPMREGPVGRFDLRGGGSFSYILPVHPVRLILTLPFKPHFPTLMI